ncbi:hypothetical protein JCM17823_08010 [Halorubrum gandharaense]
MTQRSTECPAPDCDYTDVPSLVAAHVNGTTGHEHDWLRLPYEGPGDFLAEVRGDAGDTADAETSADSEDSANSEDSVDQEYAFDPEPVFDAAAVAREHAADVDDPAALDTEALVDCYVAFSVLSGEASSVRSELKSVIVDRVREEGELAGELGSVSRSTATRRSLKDEETVRSALFGAGIDPREAETFDPDRVADLVADADIDEEAVFELEPSERLRRKDVNEAAFGGGEDGST